MSRVPHGAGQISAAPSGIAIIVSPKETPILGLVGKPVRRAASECGILSRQVKTDEGPGIRRRKMKVQVGFAAVGSCMIVSACLLLFACNSVSKSGLQTSSSDGSVKGVDGSAGSVGSGGSRGSGGALGSGGATGKGGAVGSGGIPGGGGAIGSGGARATGGAVGSGGLVARGGAVASGGGPGSGGRLGTGGNVQPGSGGAVGLGGGTGRGGSSGTGGVVGSGGSVGTGGATARDAAVDGTIPCGSRNCAAGEYCCSASCGLCVPMGAACIAIACPPDGGLSIDSGACRALPAADSLYCGGTPQQPHAYLCILSALPSPCVQVTAGNVTDGYCCP
jgi:hypothetical protein